ncbi:hypothetical protein LEP1GSC185_3370 [Leptospira licerasiae serovar Varillal str. VAR 010]|uniref:Uncharacterized protein n=1 Tax=Leptospira licerasiae str. MMD4847 TaxID=1049971 RepID=A0ABN0HD12_9LEPT|nr:hypothetical protein LEP1GSC185_3370 [Leptospira licerasiae serovar Varillal str. VAR 010]EJZ43516.1 hypothetical protein LEP1GSC178_2985 [Leptospira licerasiae str. MMD4847]
MLKNSSLSTTFPKLKLKVNFRFGFYPRQASGTNVFGFFPEKSLKKDP